MSSSGVVSVSSVAGAARLPAPDLRNVGTVEGPSASTPLDTSERTPRADRARALRATRHRAAAVASANLTAAVPTTAPSNLSAPVSVLSGVVDWSQVTQRAGVWWATSVKVAAGWTIVRSSDGLVWTDIGLPSSFSTTVVPKFAIDSSGTVVAARTTVPFTKTTGVEVGIRGGGGWTTRNGGSCGNTSATSESIASVLISGVRVAVVTATKRCVMSSLDSGVTWQSGMALTSGDVYFLEGVVLFALGCTNSAFTTGLGMFSLAMITLM